MSKQEREEYNEWLDKTEKESMFIAPLRTWNRYCPAHQDGLDQDATTIANKRIVPVDWFDVFDKDGYHVCRACGAELLTKKGKHCAAQRWCKRQDDEHEKWKNETFLNFARSRWLYIIKLAEKQIPLIQERFADLIAEKRIILHDEGKAYGSEPYFHNGSSRVVICEKCGVLASVDMVYSRYPIINVHHKVPVCYANKTNIMSIFDENNFIALCTKCHGQSHPWRKRPVPPEPKYKTLETWMK
jgi:hypothetical protein